MQASTISNSYVTTLNLLLENGMPCNEENVLTETIKSIDKNYITSRPWFSET